MIEINYYYDQREYFYKTKPKIHSDALSPFHVKPAAKWTKEALFDRSGPGAL